MNIRQKMLEGGKPTGCWLFSPNVVFLEIAARTGIDFVLIDMEHGEIGLTDIPVLLRAAQGQRQGQGMAVLVRPPSHDAAVLSKLADFGVDGLVVPKVNTAIEASAVAAACRYPPKGTRGLAAGSVRASGYGLETNYRGQADQSLLVAVQIETTDAVENMAAIAAVPEVDMMFVGPNDLSGSMGYVGVPSEASAKVTRVIEAAVKLGKPVAAIPYAGKSVADLRALGVALVVSGSDIAAMRTYLQDFKRACEERD